MIGILVRRREQTENEVVQKTDTAARLAFAVVLYVRNF